MGLFSLPPAQPREDLRLDALLGGHGNEDKIITQRTLLAEWFPQSGVQLTWPHAGTDWRDMLPEVTACYLRLAYEIARRETLLIVTPQPDEVAALLSQHLPTAVCEHVRYASCPTDDTWARDHAFLTVLDGGRLRLLDFRFNGWGGKFPATRDNAINQRLVASGALHAGQYEDHLDFELEGGSIESDGEGTLLTTTQCLLNVNRNGGLSQPRAEEELAKRLGAQRILWLSHGALAGDDTDSHIDTLARLAPDGAIVYTACANPADAHYDELKAMENELRAFRTAAGAPYRLFALPLPDAIYDADGERLPATYANYLVMNRAVLYPTYAQPENDEAARRVLAAAFPRRDIQGIDCRALIKQHGSLHCATMQYPRSILR